MSSVSTNCLIACGFDILTQDVSARYHSTTATKPLGRPGIVEGRSLAVELHVLRIDARSVNPSYHQHNFSCSVTVARSILLELTMDYSSYSHQPRST